MAASQRRMNGSWGRLALTSVVCMLIFHNGVLSEGDADADTGAPTELTIMTVPPEVMEMPARGDYDSPSDITDVAGAADPADVQPTPDSTGTSQDITDTAGAPESDDTVTFNPQLTIEFLTIFGSLDAATPRVPGDVATKATEELEPKGDIQCVDKDALKDRDAVKLELKGISSCEDTKAKLKELLGDICGEDCDIKIFQEESSSQIIVSGEDIEADAKGMAGKFSSEGIKDKLGVVEAAPRWGKHPPTVLVSLLLTGLLLAALLIGGYCLRNHRSQPTKGTKLAEESFPVDEENQGNTLVSVAPLHPQEPQEKPSANGESPEGVKIEAPPTNGHSTAKSPVADTEL
ncbi:hypothetical protein SKAU_G00169110 [Synaphobranchus kaupii]|uniref:Hematopoietic progenitor cell antigen CD34 n=1 Tax=Synaphobranchus kaupii TaxID=118154 RepID=A0A9Q1FK69_SYNKA|nr:hypothetical protein SKAU_G00169110 [Synaphobranchus kaupii]